MSGAKNSKILGMRIFLSQSFEYLSTQGGRTDMITELAHGAHTRYTPHVGQCYTDDDMSARHYAGQHGQVAWISLDLDGLSVLQLDHGYDREANEAPGDNGEDYGADVIIYEDEDGHGFSHTTWRLMTKRAVESIVEYCIEEP